MMQDGRWRQWEALDCPDIDSVHNDYQRHMPYMLYFPETEMQKLRYWAK
jgi:non-lysosomal glucosylceramidase